jgi:chromosomal replication initiator protein
MYAIMSTIKKKNPNANLVYKNCEDFTNEMVTSLQNHSMEEFREKYRAADVLLIDDIQFIGGKIQTEEEFFHTFVSLYQAGKQIILASDRPPKEIQQLSDRLRTRFESGLMADIQVPDFELRMAIINMKAASLNLTLPEDVVEFLANKLKNNVRQLEGALKKIQALYLINNIKPSLAVAQSTVADVLNTNEPTEAVIDRIITEVARYYNISADDIKSKKRTANITLARQVCMYIIREVCGLSLPQIGDVFEGRDHSTVHHSVKKIEQTVETNSAFSLQINDIINTVKGK